MLGLLLLLSGAVGFGLAAYWDLRYTEFNDWLPYTLIIIALALRGAFALMLGDLSLIINSLIVGGVFLGFGLLLYHMKQWGDGDAWLLGALGFLFPDAAGFMQPVAAAMPFPLTLFFNFFIISLFYLIIYSFLLGLRTPKVYSTFAGNVRSNAKLIAAVFIGMLFLSTLMMVRFFQLFGLTVVEVMFSLSLPFLALFMLLFFQYARAVEGDLFRRKIKARDLRPGDVLVADKWRGLTEAELLKLKKKGGDVWIKEGVRFAPVFIINLLVTLFVGSLWKLLIPGLVV